MMNRLLTLSACMLCFVVNANGFFLGGQQQADDGGSYICRDWVCLNNPDNKDEGYNCTATHELGFGKLHQCVL